MLFKKSQVLQCLLNIILTVRSMWYARVCDSVKGYLKSVELKCRFFAEVLCANSDECVEAYFSFVEVLLSLLISYPFLNCDYNLIWLVLSNGFS